MARLILLRHGQSAWNLENRFTGWTDVDLSPAGEAEALAAARLIRDEGLDFSVCHTSMLTRAIRTLHLVQQELDRLWTPVRKHWRLNERHYGALQGLDKRETAARHGEDQVFVWRRSYDVPPPVIAPDDPKHPVHDPRYADVPPDVLPCGESLEATVARVLPYWYDAIAPDLMAGRDVLVAAHGNSLRALVMHLDGLDREDVSRLDIPTGLPRLYELDAALRPVSYRYLGDPAEAEERARAVAAQGRLEKN
ncbi:2,3-diphosphoglycerate-dependent phosphoglycerate mutase [Nitratidesulfovibrio vulgaris]|uniref:2,3-bisphosphoglycerate-dependent phosphoglycerate mutase n=1 Tax=Nitratidesulfovibrio vulgaris (strain ATCC 29579 / DSM 644 / CCUG 34227 / NCIMB 8303 / VKM B-1760 / Hildenborough) TaxID=882 RepID=GPMA_NITV2|nr:2,3-diphosphoglycerate-dependent phosphoglycerate mutase [Nitratidesulfovibrio vulgaris]Q727C0.1 RecName: Full=2,3-bisphosphoglycerate-dependent phosphoglycerate mutase; Short=BPG-dependent PGAM; Short=PGAM; Short=Phosphoglyceromutase; Short=dPGM [Nitratidesulfovibrio vulgaris str. Hildenborough]AAS97407.1 phosphoglycerate mutase [Nitratidesulfovibrio vulgaris str. Hildenborough]ADP87853.1 phosphoglycerate mutase 1 family [Nitratidesulfovibrio vulgaris RCH1]